MVERRLMELWCPPALMRRRLQELADHREDLKREALEEGLSEADAEARADALLGEPRTLAQQLALASRRSSWWGRHPFIGFCLLPPFAILLLVLSIMLIEWGVSCFYFTSELFRALVNDPSGLALSRRALAVDYYAAILLTAAALCRLARRRVGGPKWALIACAVCALNGWLFRMKLGSHFFTVSVGYWSGWPVWTPVLLPLAVAAVFIGGRQRLLNAKWPDRKRLLRDCRWRRLLPKPFKNRGAGGAVPAREQPGAKTKLRLPRTGFVTPSSVIAFLLFCALAFGVAQAWRNHVRYAARQEELRSKIWPAERASAMQRIADGEVPKTTKGETLINLKSMTNAALTESFPGKTGSEGNTLAALPRGIHFFGGVPFNVEGKVQLWGRGLDDSGWRFPERVRNIRVGRKCHRIYLLQSAAFVGSDLSGKEVARLVLHYEDGSQATIAIRAGEHLLDWCGPIYTTDADVKSRRTTAAGTELAWAGTNPWIKQHKPALSLRLYKSAFDNPHPDRSVSSVDYVSTLTTAAPFLVGLTVE